MTRLFGRTWVKVAAFIIGLLLTLACCGVLASCATGGGGDPTSIDLDFDKKKSSKNKGGSKSNKSKKGSKSVKKLITYNTVLAGHFHASNCTQCHA